LLLGYKKPVNYQYRVIYKKFSVNHYCPKPLIFFAKSKNINPKIVFNYENYKLKDPFFRKIFRIDLRKNRPEFVIWNFKRKDESVLESYNMENEPIINTKHYKLAKNKLDKEELKILHQKFGTEFVYTKSGILFSKIKVKAKYIKTKSLPKIFRKKRKDPGRRGGGPRGPKEREGDSPTKKSRCEIICEKRGMTWIIVAELPEEYSKCKIVQNGCFLERLEGDDDLCFILISLDKELTIQWHEEDKKPENLKISSLINSFPILFKIQGLNREKGRLVRRPSHGYYLAIVPESWQLDKNNSAPSIAEPEHVSPPGYVAHHFFLTKDSLPVTFCQPDRGIKSIKVRGSQIDLQGDILENDHPFMGPLFGENPPTIIVDKKMEKNPIKTIVLGEEGPGRQKWRTSFYPASEEEFEIKLPLEFQEKKAGWFFLRFYDDEQEMVDSFDFRFVSGLKDIKISPESPFPPPTGHNKANICFFHDFSCRINPRFNGGQRLEIIRENESTRISIPPNPNLDITDWEIQCNEVRVEVRIVLKRIWWTLSESQKEPAEWQSKPLLLKLNNFKATSNKEIVLKFPRERWAKKVKLGFSQGEMQEFSVRVNSNTLAIPLRQFRDSSKLKTVGRHPLFAFISHRDGDGKVKIAEIEVRKMCIQCGKTFRNAGDFNNHIKTDHLENYFKELSYKEYRVEIPSLPLKIYKCKYCEYYVESHDFNQPTSAIIRHQSQDCNLVEKPYGIPLIRFEVVNDPKEIRRSVVTNLPRILKCKFCDKKFKNPTTNDKFNHLIKRHADKLYELC